MSRLAATKEYTFMQILHSLSFPVPIPIDHNRHVVVMSRIYGSPMAQLRSAALTSEASKYFLTASFGLLSRLAEYGLIHCDLNEFNLMIADPTHHTTSHMTPPSINQHPPPSSPNEVGDEVEKEVEYPYGQLILIDFPQMISTEHANAQELFERDRDGLVKFFGLRMKYNIENEVEEGGVEGGAGAVGGVGVEGGGGKGGGIILPEYNNIKKDLSELNNVYLNLFQGKHLTGEEVNEGVTGREEGQNYDQGALTMPPLFSARDDELLLEYMRGSGNDTTAAAGEDGRDEGEREDCHNSDLQQDYADGVEITATEGEAEEEEVLSDLGEEDDVDEARIKSGLGQPGGEEDSHTMSVQDRLRM